MPIVYWNFRKAFWKLNPTTDMNPNNFELLMQNIQNGLQKV